MSRIVRIIAFGCGLCGGIVASQGPEFAQQYRQRVGGAVDELRQVITRFDGDARASGETKDSAIARLRSNADDFVSRQGAAMQANVERLGRLETHRETMKQAGPFSRVFRPGSITRMTVSIPGQPGSLQAISLTAKAVSGEACSAARARSFTRSMPCLSGFGRPKVPRMKAPKKATGDLTRAGSGCRPDRLRSRRRGAFRPCPRPWR